MKIQNLKDFILDTLFPIHCLSCQKEGDFLCPLCLEKIELFSFQVCPKCEKEITPSGKLCKPCEKRHFGTDVFFTHLIVATNYKKSGIEKIVQHLKYRFIPSLALPLGKIMIKSLNENSIPIPDLVVPVPLHKRRLRWRGFNQSSLLGEYVSQNFLPGLPIPFSDKILIRKKHTGAQMKIKSYSERQNNIKNAFAVVDTKVIQNKRILLMDDVATTGATIFEAAKTLKQNGAKEIICAVIARQEIK